LLGHESKIKANGLPVGTRFGELKTQKPDGQAPSGFDFF
jgi:hypothetical protein